MRLLWVVGSLVLLVATWGIACKSAGQSCAQRTTDAQNATTAAESQAEADLSCATDSDCVLASNSSVCWNSCGVVLNQAGAAQLASAIAQINGTTCATFTADGCEPNPAPPCLAIGAYCVAGSCAYGPPGEDAGTDASNKGVICGLNSGVIDTSASYDAGPYEVCTPAYPSCTPPYPESPGYQCCLRISFEGGSGELNCMPNDASAYQGGFGP